MSFRIYVVYVYKEVKTIKLMQKGLLDMQRKTKRKLYFIKLLKKSLEKIRALLALREKMVVFKASLLRNVKEMKIFDLEISKTNNSYQKATVKALDADIKKIEKKLQTENGKKMLEVPDDISENKAYPISPEELPEPKEENEIPFFVGETIKVTDGPFSSFQGTIEAVDNERKKLTVSVKIFGRKTPMELSFTQVEKE